MRKVVHAREYSREIIMHAEEHNQRTGQYLFNSFPEEIRRLVTGTAWDPFHKNMSQFQIEEWLEDHVIFDDSGNLIGLFAGRKLLWEK